MRTLPLLLAALLLAACSTPQERAAYMQQQADEMIRVYGPACERLGYSPNTDQWRACVLHLNSQEEMRDYYYFNSPYYYGPGFWPRRRW